MPKVLVVIPVYNVETYIERALHSLFGQTLEDIEYLFVDDCSTDCSVAKITEVLDAYPRRKSQTRILHHETNRGVAAARTTGIKAATGEYVIHCDPDDYVELDMYETMYGRAAETDADIVACRYLEEWPNCKGQGSVCIAYSPTPQQCLINIYKKNRHCSRLWDKMVRRTLIVGHNILPFEGCDYAEDLGCIVRILHYAKSVSVVERALYHYCRRDNSITRNAKDRRLWDMRKKLIDNVCRFLSCDTRYEIACRQMQFYAKMEFRAAFSDRDAEWFNLYTESHRHILKYDDMPLKGRLLWRVALQNLTVFRMMKKIVPVLR